MAVYFTSDLHFGLQSMITDYNRPKKNTKEMDEFFIKNWNSSISYSDTVYILGDFSDLSLNDTINIIDKLNGHKHLIIGNHDECMIDSELFKSKFISMNFYKKIKIGNNTLILSHYPMYSWEGKGKGYIHLHGHIHDKQLQKNNGFCYNVGVDCNNYRPISYENILRNIKYPRNILPYIKLKGNESIIIDNTKIDNADVLYNIISKFKTRKECVDFIRLYESQLDEPTYAIRNVMKILRVKNDTRLKELFSRVYYDG